MTLQSNMSSAKRVAVAAILAAVAMALSLFEGTITAGMEFAIPGVKLGLANITVLFALVALGGKYSFIIAVIKAFATFLMSGSVTVLWFSLAGSIVSALAMWFCYRVFTKGVGLLGISVVGGVLHNWTQIAVMILISGTKEFLYYAPVVTLSGIASGILTGFIALAVLKKIKKV